MVNNDIKKFHSLVISNIKDLIKTFDLNCIGLVFPNQGPVGVVQLRGVLAENLEVPTVIISVNERLLRNQVWFERNDSLNLPLSPKSKVLLFCDAATSGASIYRAALIAWKFGAECSKAIVIFDRSQGAEERLSVKGISLFSIIDRRFFEDYDELKAEDVSRDGKASRIEFESISTTID